MSDQHDATGIEAGRSRWQAAYEQSRVRDVDFTTLSGVEVEPLYRPPPDRQIIL